MPTITFSLKDMENLVGKKFTIDELSSLFEHGKGEFESYDKETDEISVSFGDTNLPYLWSVEGVARLIKGLLGKKISGIDIKKSSEEVIVDRSVNSVRPYVTSFVAKGKKIDDYLIKQIIQLQEKLCENFGRRREKIAIGVYRHSKIKFPVHYKAVEPESVKFIPLDFRKEMTPAEILEEHPKGKEYSWILSDKKKYPLLVDSDGGVLSFPPIINSLNTGKIEEGDSDIFFEATGTDLNHLLLATTIFAYAFSDRGFDIFSVNVKYPTKKIVTPALLNEKVKVDVSQVKEMLGIDISVSSLKRLLERMQYDYSNGVVVVPPYRQDILHAVDVIEDVAISYGYNKLEELPLERYTAGKSKDIVPFIDKIRSLIIGLGYQEIISPMLTNKKYQYDNMNIEDFGTVEIAEYISETYSVVRSWLLPIVMEVLSKNKHVEYPQKIFEQGIVTVRKDGIKDYERLALVSAHEDADFTEVKQVLDYILRMAGLDYSIEEVEHGSFIPGRVGRVIVDGKKVAFIGEISPSVLAAWEIQVPVVGLEINLSELF